MLRTFVDDSGSNSNSPLMVLAALVSSTEQWKKFSDDWNTALNQAPKIEYYKSSEYVTLTRCFSKISREDADRKTGILADVLLSHSFYGRVSCIIWDEYRDHVEPRIPMRRGKPQFPVFTNPYFICFHDVISMVCMNRLGVVSGG